MKRWLILLILGAVISLPPLDPFLEAEMYRQMLVQIPCVLALGIWWGRPSTLPQSWVVGWFVLSLGSVMFWMIPRTLDMSVSHAPMDALMHLCLFLSGWGIGSTYRRLPHVAQLAVGIWVTSMWSSFAMVLLFSASRVCARFTMEQQQTAGIGMFWLGGAFFLIHIIWSIRSMIRLEQSSRPSLSSYYE